MSYIFVPIFGDLCWPKWMLINILSTWLISCELEVQALKNNIIIIDIFDHRFFGVFFLYLEKSPTNAREVFQICLPIVVVQVAKITTM